MARPNHIPHISKRLLKRGSFIIKQPIKFNQGLPLCAIKALLSTQTIKDDDKKFLLLQNLNRIHLSTRKDRQLKSSKEKIQQSIQSNFSKNCLKEGSLLFACYDLSFASNETKFKNPITKTQNNFVIFGFFHKKMILSFWLFLK